MSNYTQEKQGMFFRKKIGANDNYIIYSYFVPGAGIEPARSHLHRILNPARLPIPPPGPSELGMRKYTYTSKLKASHKKKLFFAVY